MQRVETEIHCAGPGAEQETGQASFNVPYSGIPGSSNSGQMENALVFCWSNPSGDFTIKPY